MSCKTYLKNATVLTSTTWNTDYKTWFKIVVIGSQSAGKSSVFEKIVGKNFLPSGNGCAKESERLMYSYDESWIWFLKWSGNFWFISNKWLPLIYSL